MKEQLGKMLLEENFKENLVNEFQLYCREQCTEPEIFEFIQFIFEKNIISSKTIHHLSILSAYNDLRRSSDVNKTQAVNILSNRFSISSRTIWSILKEKSS